MRIPRFEPDRRDGVERIREEGKKHANGGEEGSGVERGASETGGWAGRGGDVSEEKESRVESKVRG